jgi:hypothetical protein
VTAAQGPVTAEVAAVRRLARLNFWAFIGGMVLLAIVLFSVPEGESDSVLDLLLVALTPVTSGLEMLLAVAIYMAFRASSGGTALVVVSAAAGSVVTAILASVLAFVVPDGLDARLGSVAAMFTGVELVAIAALLRAADVLPGGLWVLAALAGVGNMLLGVAGFDSNPLLLVLGLLSFAMPVFWFRLRRVELSPDFGATA